MKHTVVCLISAALLILSIAPASARAALAPLDPADLEAFADAFFAVQMAERHIPGAVLIVVQDGKVLLSKGYGFANREKRIPMDPETTVVRIGSVSKLFVATAVMQLAEQGQLDLHADVNRYLTTFQLDDNYPEPVTLAHLLSHTAGFDDFYPPPVFDPAGRQPLGDYLAEHMPPRISPVGEMINYSNHGYALAGYIVEQVSGMPFDEYVAGHILSPLRMHQSRYLLSLPLPEERAVGYVYQDGTYLSQAVDYDHDYPGGSMVSTAADMARFMLAHLGGGCYGDACILQPATVAEMHEQQFTHHPQLPGWTYGFEEEFHNGQRVIGHGGAIRGFGNSLAVVPEHKLGYFISFNCECAGSSACGMLSAFDEQFFDRYFPAESGAPPVPVSEVPLSRLAGRYRYVRHHHTTINKLWVFENDTIVATNGDTLVVHNGEFRQIAPLMFQEVNGDRRFAFRVDGWGRVTHMFGGPHVYERLAWYETSPFHHVLFEGFGWLWGAIAAAWLAIGFIRRRGGQPAEPLLVRCTYGPVVAMLVLNATFLISLDGFFWRSPGTMKTMLVLPLVSTGLGVGVLIVAGLLWWRRRGSLAGRVYYAVVALVAACFTWFLDYWNMLGFHFG